MSKICFFERRYYIIILSNDNKSAVIVVRLYTDIAKTHLVKCTHVINEMTSYNN